VARSSSNGRRAAPKLLASVRFPHLPSQANFPGSGICADVGDRRQLGSRGTLGGASNGTGEAMKLLKRHHLICEFDPERGCPSPSNRRYTAQPQAARIVRELL
jgi:hypothetical protein